MARRKKKSTSPSRRRLTASESRDAKWNPTCPGCKSQSTCESNTHDQHHYHECHDCHRVWGFVIHHKQVTSNAYKKHLATHHRRRLGCSDSSEEVVTPEDSERTGAMSKSKKSRKSKSTKKGAPRISARKALEALLKAKPTASTEALRAKMLKTHSDVKCVQADVWYHDVKVALGISSNKPKAAPAKAKKSQPKRKKATKKSKKED